MNSANPLLKDPDVSMNDQQTDPTLDFLEQQFPSSQSMIEMEDLFRVNPVTSHDQDLAPSSVESRGNSRPLESSQSTPVPVPIERETQPSDLLPLTDSSNLPRLNIQRVDVSSEEVKAAVTILDSQWNLFLRARSNNNAQLMRAALMQACTNQLVLLQLVGREAMMRLSHQWNAKDELDKLEAKMLSQLQNSNMVIDQDLATQTTPNSSSTLREMLTNPQRNAPSDQVIQPNAPYLTSPPNETRHSNPPPTTLHQQASLPPSAPETDSRYHPASQNVIYQIPPHHLGYPYNTHHLANQYQVPNKHSPQTGYHYQNENVSHRQNNLPRQGNNQNRGRGRNRQRNRDSTSNMMEIGNFFVWAKRALNAMQQRGRGRRSRRQGRGNNQTQANNPAPQ
ncbi:hypothetical protein PCASD_11851 [Puccinia coronata f. sp. avenae]|uniref:Uncharacterized protein n=1 Tax=Puccinia coronata f. sp. avenae TaxID=200324 RepID=A0A2N5UTP6_9BASI|nr:hypothetical protein PCASD_11851 [Puccinia coronata f. sp. avenae]